MEKRPSVIAFSYAKRALKVGSRERLRMAQYASVLSSFHVVVFTTASEGHAPYQEEDNLHLYATNSTTKIGMLIDAYKIGRKISGKESEMQWTVSAQDPLQASIVPLILSLYRNNTLHIQIHGDVFNPAFFTGDRLGILKRWYAQWVLKRAHKIRVVSDRIKSSLIVRHIPESRIVVVPIQADIEAFLLVGKDRVYHTDLTVNFLYVGRLAKEKNLELLLTAFAQSRNQGMSAFLTILGDGPLKAQMEAKTRRLGMQEYVHYESWTDSVPAAMAAADVLCLSSWHEGYAMVLLEAMAAGLPIITTDVGCAGSLMVDNESGKVAHDFSIATYAALIQSLAHDFDTREQFGRAGHHKAQTLLLSQSDYLHAIAQSFTV